MMKSAYFQSVSSSRSYWLISAIAGVITLAGLIGAEHMESAGHWVTGMSNQVVWGVPHVFAIFLIVAASGALNTASIASVFARDDYKPLARLSALLAIALLSGGLAVLVLDLGRPDRLIVAMTHYNFKSIFAWNIFLYIGFMFIVGIYLWMMFEPRMNRFTARVGTAAFIWRLVLTTGTGSIFGFLVAREAFDSAVMAPLFIVMSLSFGTALTLLIGMLIFWINGATMDPALAQKLRRLLGFFVIGVAYLVAVDHLTKLYVTGHHQLEQFILVDGGIYTLLFWGVQILLGTMVPAILLLLPRFCQRGYLIAAALLVVVGALTQVYVLIIGGQVFPLELFPGYSVTSTFYDGVIADYTPSLAELALGMGGMGLAVLVTLIGIRILPFVPVQMTGENQD
ncbi:MAG: polysulfide reductase NrfD [Arenicellales bacterium]|nr:polysulfide reductase NrfD [Arenicellales bacterium]